MTHTFPARGLLLASAAALALASAGAAQGRPQRAAVTTTAAVSEADLRARVGILAHDSMAGRETGTPGIVRARDYLAREAARLGLRPAGDSGTFLHHVALARTDASLSAAARTRDGGEVALRPGTDVVFLNGVSGVPGGPRETGEGPLVYGGYLVDGSVTGAAELTAAQLDGAVLVLHMGTAPGVGMQQPRFQLPRLWAPDSKLAAIVIVADEGVETFWGYGLELVGKGAVERAGAPQAPRGNGPPLFFVRPDALARMVGAEVLAGRTPTTGLGTFRYTLRQQRTPVDAWNVVAVLPGSDPTRAGEHVALGAHYDHDGVGPAVRGDSVYNGADDDASGTAALLEIAERFAGGPASARPARSLLFVWHTAEEKGLLGSEAFAERMTVPRPSVVAQLNLDMVARNGTDSLYLVGSRRLSTELGGIVEAVNREQPRPFTFDYSWDAPNHPEQIYCRSDHYNYAKLGIPVTFFTSGLHPEYHQPQDEAATLDYGKLARVTALVGDVAAELANRATRPRVDRAPRPGECQ